MRDDVDNWYSGRGGRADWMMRFVDKRVPTQVRFKCFKKHLNFGMRDAGCGLLGAGRNDSIALALENK